MQLLPAICSFKLKNFVSMLLLLLSPMNEDSINPGTCTKNKNETCHIRTFIMISTMLNLVRSTDWVVKENY